MCAESGQVAEGWERQVLELFVNRLNWQFCEDEEANFFLRQFNGETEHLATLENGAKLNIICSC